MASPRVRRLRRAARSGEVQVTAAPPVAKSAPVVVPVVEEVCEEDPCEVEECETHPEEEAPKKSSKKSSKKVKQTSAKKAY